MMRSANPWRRILSMTLLARLIVVAALLVAAPGLARASSVTFVNGGFETGTFAGWQTVGDASVQTASVGISPPGGCCMALVTSIVGGIPFGPQPSGTDVIASFLGYSPQEFQTALDRIGFPPHEAPFPEGQSGIKQIFEGYLGEQLRLSFDFYWVTTETRDTVDGGVFSLVTSDGSLVTPDGNKFLFLLSPGVVPLLDSQVPLCQHVSTNCSPSANKITGGSVEFRFDPTQPTTTYTLGFAVWNTLDNLAPSAMFIDNVRVRAVPWGANLTLVALGSLLLVVLTARARP
jgi:hypothetical protein